MKKIELLAPAGDMEKLKVAFHYGADAVYFAGKKFGLRAFATNFSDISEPVNYAHKLKKKTYLTLNVYPRNNEIDEIVEYIKEIERVKPDGVLVSDIGIMKLVKKYAPSVPLHISTQANTTSLNSALTYAEVFGAKRVVLARELPFEDIKTIANGLKKVGCETEVFVHGAMCISYSGRCLLSNYLTGRDSNRGECVQACRWGYALKEIEQSVNENYTEKNTGEYEILEDGRGSYILNSKDMCLVEHLDEILKSGVASLKIEGRMKSPYYLATVVNAYRRKLDELNSGKKDTTIKNYTTELEKSSHRDFTTGFMFDDKNLRENYKSSHQTQTSVFVGMIDGVKDGKLLVEMRNRFKVGDKLEILSPSSLNNKVITIKKIETTDGEDILDAKKVQEKLLISTDLSLKDVSKLEKFDILRTV